MLNFELQLPTKIIFGKGVIIDNIGKEIKAYGKKVLIHHDGGEYLKKLDQGQGGLAGQGQAERGRSRIH